MSGLFQVARRHEWVGPTRGELIAVSTGACSVAVTSAYWEGSEMGISTAGVDEMERARGATGARADGTGALKARREVEKARRGAARESVRKACMMC